MQRIIFRFNKVINKTLNRSFNQQKCRQLSRIQWALVWYARWLHHSFHCWPACDGTHMAVCRVVGLQSETWYVVLNISKTFDSVLHQNLLTKLRSYIMTGNHTNLTFSQGYERADRRRWFSLTEGLLPRTIAS